MTLEQLLTGYREHHSFSDEDILALKADGDLRKALVNHIRTNKDRQFSLALLDKMIEVRKKRNEETTTVFIYMETVMLGCYLLRLHGHVEDCLKVWQAKTVDFDTYCGVDVQLVVFAGVDPTIAYLRTQTSKEAADALEYISDCAEGGDFDELEAYQATTPWWL